MAAISSQTSIDFCTLGMLIIDDIYPSPTALDQTPQIGILGGAGTYSAIGARLFSPPPHTSKSIGWIIDAGADFPPDLRETIASWQTGVLIRPRDAPTTRAWNGYGANDHRAFKYLNEKKRLTADDLSPELLGAKSFHLICSAKRCVELVKRILQRRKEELQVELPRSVHGEGKPERPIFIWEPVPDLCTPAELKNTYAALRHVDVISPNHAELASFFSVAHPSTGVEKAVIERQTNDLLAHGIGPTNDGAVVVRAGKEGCFVATLNRRKWLPAYHTPLQSPDSESQGANADGHSRVVDPTGGGNGFLGGFAVGLVRGATGGDVIEAARWGSVAASFCIEQVGMPRLETVIASSTCVDEVWNGESVGDRLEEFRRRTT